MQLERKLSDVETRLEESEKNAVIVALAGTAAHELNQPLTSVMGYAELLKRKLKDEDFAYRPGGHHLPRGRAHGGDRPEDRARSPATRPRPTWGAAHPRPRTGLGRRTGRPGLQGMGTGPHLAPLELSRRPKIWRVCAYFPTSVS